MSLSRESSLLKRTNCIFSKCIQFSGLEDPRYYPRRRKCSYVRKCRSSRRCTRVRMRMSVRRYKGHYSKPQYRVRCRPVRKCRTVRVCRRMRQGKNYAFMG